jgi:hypothetical protein
MLPPLNSSENVPVVVYWCLLDSSALYSLATFFFNLHCIDSCFVSASPDKGKGVEDGRGGNMAPIKSKEPKLRRSIGLGWAKDHPGTLKTNCRGQWHHKCDIRNRPVRCTQIQKKRMCTLIGIQWSTNCFKYVFELIVSLMWIYLIGNISKYVSVQTGGVRITWTHDSGFWTLADSGFFIVWIQPRLQATGCRPSMLRDPTIHAPMRKGWKVAGNHINWLLLHTWYYNYQVF